MMNRAWGVAVVFVVLAVGPTAHSQVLTQVGTRVVINQQVPLRDGDQVVDGETQLRLDLTNAEVFISRGLAWYAKAEYDKAFADYSEAIRLDPKSCGY